MTDDFDEEGDLVDPQADVTSDEQLIVECLDIGLVLVGANAKIRCSNRVARHALAEFGSGIDAVPGALWTALRPLLAAAAAAPGRFTPASPIVARNGRRFFVRCRQLAETALVTISPAALRENDVRRVLAEQFGLSAQEIRIAFLAAQGHRNREIGEELDVVEGTVKNYLTSVFAALSVRSRTELASELARLLEEQSDVHRRP